jgi:transposase
MLAGMEISMDEAIFGRSARPGGGCDGGWTVLPVAAERFGVAPSTADNWHRLFRERKSYSPLSIGGDRRSKLLDEIDWLAGHLAETPDLRLRNVQHAFAERGVEVSCSGAQRMVEQLGVWSQHVVV